MEFNDLEYRALDVRHAAAVRLMERGEITGIEALASIVCPSPDMLAASLTVAGEVRERRPSPRTVRRPSRTLDETLIGVR